MSDKNDGSHKGLSELMDSGELFTEKLVLILQGNAFRGTLPIDGSNKLNYRGQQVTPIVPLKSLILNQLEPHDIAGAVWFEQIGTEIRVYFNSPSSVLHGKKQTTGMKSYNFNKGDMIVHMAVPLLEIWPDFVCPDWKIYFSYFSNIGKGSTFYAHPFTKNSGDLEKAEFKNGQGKIEREIVKSDHFPEAYECKTEWGNSSKQLVAGDAGILLLEKPGKREKLRKKFNIGVNFGVTCTNIYIREESNLPEPMVFNEHLFKITDPPPGKNESERKKDHYFFPSFKVDMPLLNIFCDFHLKETRVRPFLDGHIYFPHTPGEPCTADNLVRVGPKSRTAYEWERVRVYLEQLCVMCSAEVACKGALEIKWYFSYPNSLSSAAREAFKNICKGIILDNSSKTGLEPLENEPLYKNEFIATSGYFSNHPDIRATIPGGVVFMTIGTRASNISIWQGMKDQLLVQTSLPFASWGIFSYPLWKRTEFLEFFFNQDQDAMRILTSEGLQKNKTAFYTQLEALVNTHCDFMLQKLPALGGDRIVRGFRHLVALAISGLFYYIGLILSSLTGSDIYEECTPAIYIGGSGSRLLHWLANGNYSPSSAVNKLFRAVFFQAYGISRQNSFRIVLSLHPGAEAAYDLAVDKNPLPYNKEKMREFFFLAGETFENLNGEQFQWDTRLSLEQIKGGIKVSSTLEHLETFLNAFDREAASAGIPLVGENSHWLAKTLNQVNQILSSLAAADENKIRVEPLFIIALKEFLQLKVDEWTGDY